MPTNNVEAILDKFHQVLKEIAQIESKAIDDLNNLSAKNLENMKSKETAEALLKIEELRNKINNN